MNNTITKYNNPQNSTDIISKVRPRSLFDLFFDERFDRAFDNFWFTPISSIPRLDLGVESKETEYTIEIPLAGFTKESIKIRANGNLLTIKAKTLKSSVIRNYEYPDWDTAKANTKFENGLLTITVPKVDKVETGIEIPVG